MDNTYTAGDVTPMDASIDSRFKDQPVTVEVTECEESSYQREISAKRARSRLNSNNHSRNNSRSILTNNRFIIENELEESEVSVNIKVVDGPDVTTPEHGINSSPPKDEGMIKSLNLEVL